MRCLLFFSIACWLFCSCKKTEIVTAEFSEATYKLTFAGTWQSPQFAVPAGAHFTSFTGMVHNQHANLWQPGKLSSSGIEYIAETGYQVPLFFEVDSMMAKKNAIAQINIPPPSPNGNISRTIYCNSKYSFISFAAMIAPSPDWFIGVHDLNLYNNGKWVADTTVQLYVYDAGTEDGDVFGYDNPPTNPQQPIQLLTPSKATVLANGNMTLAPIANVRITLQ